MKLALWLMALGVLAGIVLWARHLSHRRADRSRRGAIARRKRESNADKDKRDILALTNKLNASSEDPEAAVSEGPKVGRQRRSSVKPHGFDPDLPPR